MGRARLLSYLRLARPWQWVKNGFVFAPMVFAGRLLDPDAVKVTALVFAAFSLASSAAYALNDVFDRNRDRAHPAKGGRPLASGAVSVPEAVILAAVVAGAAAALAWHASVLWTVGGYLLLQISYSVLIKHVVILDVLAVASGFVLRVLAGGEALDIEVSPWLILCTFLLSLFLATTKRRQEVASKAEETTETRPVLGKYSPSFLDQMVSVETSAAVLAYAIYAVSPDTIEKFGTTALIWTIPFVIYGIFRYLYLVYKKGAGEDPALVLIKDKPLALNLLLWLLVCIFIIYGRRG